MNDILNLEIESILKKLLFPMINIMDKKNIYSGIDYVYDSNDLFIIFNRDCLSKTNQLIMEKISFVYSDTFFYSNDKDNPNSDKLEYWCPEKEYDEKYHITERIHNKQFLVLKLDLNDIFTILGTTIMLANNLQEQDPMDLKINENEKIFSSEIIQRHQHYVDSNYPDMKWLSLSIVLNNDNPLNQNPYAPIISQIELNSSVCCENILSSIMVGFNEKKYIIFNMEKEDLEKNIRLYYESMFSYDENVKNIPIQEIQQKLLKNN